MKHHHCDCSMDEHEHHEHHEHHLRSVEPDAHVAAIIITTKKGA